MALQLSSLQTRRRPQDLPCDKPQVDRVEHANLERPGASLHPVAKARRGTSDWSHYRAGPVWR